MRPAANNPTHTLRETDASASGSREPAPPSNELPVDDPSRYQIQGELAQGGLGRVLQAVDERLGRTVALKELLRRSEVGEARFVREALITARLQHPGIVPVHEAGRWPSGEPYYVMKLISGQSLKELIAAQERVEARLGLLPHVIAIAETIAYAHSERVLHRDIKPSNVVVGEYGETVVVDWGIAKEMDAGPLADMAPLSRPLFDPAATLGVVGTPAFMAPEQAAGADVDERTDVYALGAVLYNVLSGEPPYQGDSSDDVVKRVLAGPPPALEQLEPRLPQDLIAIAAKAMARDPAARYPTARQFVSDLKRFQTGQLVRAHNYTTFTLLRRFILRHSGVVGVGLVGTVLLAAGAWLSVGRIIHARVLAEDARVQAELAQTSTEARRVELIFLQAKTSLSRDPTETLAWLKQYPEGGPAFPELGPMIEDARARGVARHVLPHPDWLFAIAFSPDSQQLASANQDGKVRLFDVATGAERVLGAHETSVQALTFSRNGHWLATGNQRGEVIVWDLVNGTQRAFEGHVERVDTLLFGRNDEMLLSAGADNTVRTWDVKTGAKIGIFEEKTADTGAFAPDASGIVVALRSGEVQAVDPATGYRVTLGRVPDARRAALDFGARRAAIVDAKGRVWVLGPGEVRVRQLGEHPGKIEWLEFSPSGRLLVSAGQDHAIRVWDVAGSDHRVLRGHEDAIYHAVFSEDESMLASAGDDGTARLWQLKTGVAHVLRGHSDDVYRVAISKDGSYVASASLDATVRIWSTRFDDSRSMVAPPCGEGCRLYTSADGHHALSFAPGRDLVVHDFDTGESRQLGPIPDTKRPVVAVSGDVNYVAVATDETGRIELYDVKARTRVRLGVHGDSVTDLAFSPDGAALISTGPDGRVRRWDTHARNHVLLSEGIVVKALALSFGREEVALATAQDLRLVDLSTGSIKYQVAFDQLGFEGFMPDRLVVSEDGLRLAALSRGDVIGLWDIQTGQLNKYAAGGHGIVDMTLSPDGSWLAAAIADRTIHLWSLSDGDEQVLSGHRDLVMQVRFSPDSQTLASSSYDTTIRFWDRDGWRPRVLRGHSQSVDGIAFSPQGDQLISASRDGTLRAWQVHQQATSPTSTRARLNLTSAIVTEQGRVTSL